ncbi:KTSC domain-containing protein [Bacillus thuringiensis]|uniref:KTSC domain-containing protein n=1 Tax=Bacillus TaxID=1386 RepID=UPI0009959705|nr:MULTISPECIES: KTSC domain-containing protein [Bacillus cereus group]MDA2245443.1 KTSC domain-containing protein [Bacillus cereus]OPA18169.1 KTSC domain-containing protein [Bacillus cereus]PER41766.1 KTSC domain-containing protein [Bacillus thuringiensis]PGW31790.1 KTSC domain-containing protein [Bacillus thuringiensis]
MERQPVSSSRMSSVGWENDVLEIQFKDGSIYQYFDVSHSEYISFINSPSLGSALSRLDKVHRYSRVI